MILICATIRMYKSLKRGFLLKIQKRSCRPMEQQFIRTWFKRQASGYLKTMLVIAMLGLATGCDLPKESDLPLTVTLNNLNGTTKPISEYRGKLLVLNVWATWCPPCRKEMPSLERLSKKANNSHIQVAGIATDESENAIREFVSQHNITFEIYTDTQKNVKENLGVRVFPETLLVAPDGKIVHRIIGEREWDSDAMIKALEEVYQGKRNGLDFSRAATSQISTL